MSTAPSHEPPPGSEPATSRVKMTRRGLLRKLVVLAMLALALPAVAQQSRATRTVVPSERYAAGGLQRFLFGHDYRELWTTPIEVEVLDLERTAGGLDPVMVVGRNQTLGLALRGADGNSYTFRSLDKDPTSVLPPELLGTPIADLAQDQISSNFPGAPLVAGPIAEAAGVRQSSARLMLMPDSERLGEFREEFGGLLGTFFQYPTEGSWGATEILAGEEMVELTTTDPLERIDGRAFLRARLLDQLMGDWDRHVGQWRWARIPGEGAWQPIAEDRDQAFSRYDGIAMSFQRNRDPRFDLFATDYQALEGLTWNGRSVDRRLLTGLELEDFRAIAADLQRRLTDRVFAEALRELPPEWAELAGADLERRLRARRDDLVRHAEAYYRHLAEEVDVWGSDRPDRFRLERRADGGLEVTVAVIASGGSRCDLTPGEIYYRRSFEPLETEQVRLYTGLGDDRIVVAGEAVGGVEVKIVGGAGDETVCFEGGAALSFDAAGVGRAGPGEEIAADIWLAPGGSLREAGTPVDEQGAPRDARRDWGSTTYTTPWFGAGPDIGFFGGLGWTKEIFGFRKRPFAAQHTLRLGFSSATLRPKFEYLGVVHRENRDSLFRMRAFVSGIETLNFYGIGNETEEPDDDDFRRARRNAVELAAWFVQPLGERAELSTGPVARFSGTQDDDEGDRLVSVLRPYGVERTVQVGWRAGLRFNRRERVRVLDLKETDDPERFGWPALGAGLTFDLDAEYYPELFDLREDYLRASATATASTRLWSGPALAFRVGGERIWGEAPYYDLAILGEDQILGLASDRFTGDSSLYGNVLVAAPVGPLHLIVPGHWGLLARAGLGRVWVGGEDSSTWHWGAGGGVWWAPWDFTTAVRISIATSDEGVRGYLRLGFDF